MFTRAQWMYLVGMAVTLVSEGAILLNFYPLAGSSRNWWVIAGSTPLFVIGCWVAGRGLRMSRIEDAPPLLEQSSEPSEDTEEDPVLCSVPRHLDAVRREAAARGVTVAQVFEDYFAAGLASGYPTDSCFDETDFDEIRETGDISDEQQDHAGTCSTCARLAAMAKKDGVVGKMF